MCVYNPLVTIVKHSGFCGWKVLSEYKVIILTWQFCLPTLVRITTDFSSGSDGFSMFQINISNHLKENLGDWKFSSVKRVYCFLMWFGNYKVCVSPAFLCCSDSFNFRYTKVLTCSPFTALLQWLFFKTIQLDSFAFLCLLWVYLQPVGKVTSPKCSAWISKGVAGQGVVSPC